MVAAVGAFAAGALRVVAAFWVPVTTVVPALAELPSLSMPSLLRNAALAAAGRLVICLLVACLLGAREEAFDVGRLLVCVNVGFIGLDGRISKEDVFWWPSGLLGGLETVCEL